MFSLIRKKKLYVKILVPKLKETLLYGTRREVQLDPKHGLLASIFRQKPELNSIITLPRNTKKQLLGLFIKCDTDFLSFYLLRLREHKWMEQGAQKDSGAQNVEVAKLMGDLDENSLTEI